MLEEFLKKNEFDYSKKIISKSEIPKLEECVGIRFGKQLIKYLTKYGYLGYKHIELYGVNSDQLLKSDMIVETLWLHDNFSKTKELVVIEDQGDSDYYLVDTDDNMYRFIASNNELKKTNLKLNDYIIKRFMSI